MLGLIKRIVEVFPLSNMKILKLILLCLIGWYFFKILSHHKIYFNNVYFEITNVKIKYIFVSIFLYFLSIAFRILRWDVFFPNQKSRYIIKSYLSGFLSNLIIPAKLGEILRIDACRTFFDVSTAHVIGKIILEKLLDLYFVSIIFYAGVLFAFKMSDFEKVAYYLILINLIAFSSFVFLKKYNLYFGFKKIDYWFKNFKQAVCFIKPKDLPILFFLQARYGS